MRGTKLWTNASVRRFARLLLDKSEHRKEEILGALDTQSRAMVIEEILRLRKER